MNRLLCVASLPWEAVNESSIMCGLHGIPGEARPHIIDDSFTASQGKRGHT